MDGVVLADALTAPTRAQQDAQDRLAGPLMAYQDAIIRRSQLDLTAQGAQSR